MPRPSSSSGTSPTARPRRWPIADAFRAIMLAFVVATLLVPFLRNVTAPKVPVREAH